MSYRETERILNWLDSVLKVWFLVYFLLGDYMWSIDLGNIFHEVKEFERFGN